jgi:hypothetical protein
MEIPNIGTRNIQIRELNIPPVINALENTSQSIPYAPPVVVNIGVPIVDVPGCVEAHESNNKSKTVGQDDSKGETKTTWASRTSTTSTTYDC